jgi:O-antigen biosynthesis protein
MRRLRRHMRDRLVWREPGWQGLAAAVWLRRRLRGSSGSAVAVAAAHAFRVPAGDRRPRVLVCDMRVPTPDRDAGSLRIATMLRLLAPLCARLTFVPLNPDHADADIEALRRDGVEVERGSVFGLGRFARRNAGGYDVVVLSRPEVASAFLPAVRRHFPRAMVVFDTVDLHFVREQRMLAVDGNAGGVRPERTRQRELALVDACDVTATVTGEEAALIRRLRPAADVVVLPTVHEVRSSAPGPLAARAGLLFIGSFQHRPNVDAVAHLLDDVMPRVRSRIPGVQLTVIGANPPAELARRAGRDVHFAGYVEDVTPYFDSARVFVSPLRFGAGMKGKNGQAMSLGLPMVTTSIGAEGMDLVHGTHALIADGAADIAECVANLHEDRVLWERLAANARELAAQRWSPDAMRVRLQALLQRSGALPAGLEDDGSRTEDALAGAVRAVNGHLEAEPLQRLAHALPEDGEDEHALGA